NNRPGSLFSSSRKAISFYYSTTFGFDPKLIDRNWDIFELKTIATVPSRDFDIDYEVRGPFYTSDWPPEYKVAVTVRDPGKGIGFMRTLTHVKKQHYSYNSRDEITIPKYQSDGSIKYSYSVSWKQIM